MKTKLPPTGNGKGIHIALIAFCVFLILIMIYVFYIIFFKYPMI